MRAAKLSWLLNYFVRNPQRRADHSDYRLTVLCEASLVAPLRKQLFWETHCLGLRAGDVVVEPLQGSLLVTLTLRLECPLGLRPTLDQLALRLSRQPQIRRVRWGRWHEQPKSPGLRRIGA